MTDPEIPDNEQMEIQLKAMLGMVGDMAKPRARSSLRAVLERNETIVDQRPEAIDHLLNELIDAIYPKEIFG